MYGPDFINVKRARTSMFNQKFSEHVSQGTRTLVISYLNVRRGIGLIGLALPLMLGPFGLMLGINIQENMSSYYHTALRDVFVGSLCAIGVFLLCYRGYDWIEAWTGRFGCFFALGVALCPLDANSDPLFQRTIVGYLHTVFGAGFFTTLAVYSLYHFPVTAAEVKDCLPSEEIGSQCLAERNFIYRLSGIVILVALLTMGGYLFLLPVEWREDLNEYKFLFWMEWIAVWSFAAAWLTKGRAIFAEIAVDLLSSTRHLLAHSKQSLHEV
jgi:hypothetical protein